MNYTPPRRTNQRGGKRRFSKPSLVPYEIRRRSRPGRIVRGRRRVGRRIRRTRHVGPRRAHGERFRGRPDVFAVPVRRTTRSATRPVRTTRLVRIVFTYDYERHGGGDVRV